MKTLAAILVEQNKPLELMEVEIPSLQWGQVLVELSSSRICGSQLGEIAGVKGPDRWLPHLLGHEGCGRVLEIGPDVKTVSPGDKVCLHWRPGDGMEGRPPVYQSDFGRINAGFITTFNHHAIISENRMTVVPGTLDDEIVCLLADTLTTGFGIINNDAVVKIGESVVVIGCGGIGLGVIQGASLAGAYPIIAVDIHDHKLEVSRQFGTHYTVNARNGDFVEEIIQMLGGKADVVADGTGDSSVIEQAYELTKSTGRTILYGVMPHDKKVSIHTLPLHFGKTLTGSEGGSSQPNEDIPRYLRMMNAGLFDPKPMISHRGKLEDVNSLIEKMKAGEVIHSILEMRGSRSQ